MIKVGDKNFYPTWAKIRFFGKKVGGGGWKPLKISQKLNQLRFGSNFQDKLKSINDQSLWQTFLPHHNQNPFLAKKGGGEKLQNQPKTQPTQIWLKFSGQAKTNKWSKLVTKFFTPPKPKSDFLAKKEGGRKPPKISQKLNQLSFGSNFQGKLKPIND